MDVEKHEADEAHLAQLIELKPRGHYGAPENSHKSNRVFYNQRITRIATPLAVRAPGILMQSRIVNIPGAGLRHAIFVSDDRFGRGLKNWLRPNIWVEYTEEWLKLCQARAEAALAESEAEMKAEAEALQAAAEKDALDKAVDAPNKEPTGKSVGRKLKRKGRK